MIDRMMDAIAETRSYKARHAQAKATAEALSIAQHNFEKVIAERADQMTRDLLLHGMCAMRTTENGIERIDPAELRNP